MIYDINIFNKICIAEYRITFLIILWILFVLNLSFV